MQQRRDIHRQSERKTAITGSYIHPHSLQFVSGGGAALQGTVRQPTCHNAPFGGFAGVEVKVH
eukprot:scaffold112352_cov47-Prasinocladus_malaysianus.AAC.1